MHIHHFYHAHIISRLAIRHQLWVHGSRLTPEEAQVIDNKQGHLQRLINTFEHQADSFLLRQSSLDDLPIFPVCDYTEYDVPDQPGLSTAIDVKQPTSSVSHSIPEGDSDGAGMVTANPANLLILLPSTLGWEWCVLRLGGPSAKARLGGGSLDHLMEAKH